MSCVTFLALGCGFVMFCMQTPNDPKNKVWTILFSTSSPVGTPCPHPPTPGWSVRLEVSAFSKQALMKSLEDRNPPNRHIFGCEMTATLDPTPFFLIFLQRHAKSQSWHTAVHCHMWWISHSKNKHACHAGVYAGQDQGEVVEIWKTTADSHSLSKNIRIYICIDPSVYLSSNLPIDLSIYLPIYIYSSYRFNLGSETPLDSETGDSKIRRPIQKLDVGFRNYSGVFRNYSGVFRNCFVVFRNYSGVFRNYSGVFRKNQKLFCPIQKLLQRNQKLLRSSQKLYWRDQIHHPSGHWAIYWIGF